MVVGDSDDLSVWRSDLSYFCCLGCLGLMDNELDIRHWIYNLIDTVHNRSMKSIQLNEIDSIELNRDLHFDSIRKRLN